MEFKEMRVSLREEVWEDDIPTEMNDLFSDDLLFNQNTADFVPLSSFEALSPSFEQSLTSFPLDQACYCPSVNDLSGIQKADFVYNGFQTSPFTFPVSYFQEEKPLVLPFEASCITEGTTKLQKKPSKNLMAERRRRKRLNERLSMLRSIVPKISKMDRTAILGDTIDYMKELFEKIRFMKREIQVGPCTDVKLNESSVKSSQKAMALQLEVEERNGETWIEIRCPGKPGLLSLTVNTLEALGLEIKECVISSFNDFALQASCSKESKQATMADPEEIKNALFKTAGIMKEDKFSK